MSLIDTKVVNYKKVKELFSQKEKTNLNRYRELRNFVDEQKSSISSATWWKTYRL